MPCVATSLLHVVCTLSQITTSNPLSFLIIGPAAERPTTNPLRQWRLAESQADVPTSGANLTFHPGMARGQPVTPRLTDLAALQEIMLGE